MPKVDITVLSAPQVVMLTGQPKSFLARPITSAKVLNSIVSKPLAHNSSMFRTCLHKKCMRIFEHNFVADKAKIRRRADARQGFLTQYAAKFAEKACAYAYEDRFSYFALLFGSILHSSLVVYNTVIILFPRGIVKQTKGFIRVKKQAVCELFVKIRKSSEKGLTK